MIGALAAVGIVAGMLAGAGAFILLLDALDQRLTGMLARRRFRRSPHTPNAPHQKNGGRSRVCTYNDNGRTSIPLLAHGSGVSPSDIRSSHRI